MPTPAFAKKSFKVVVNRFQMPMAVLLMSLLSRCACPTVVDAPVDLVVLGVEARLRLVHHVHRSTS